MTRTRKLLFSVIVVALVFCVIEGTARLIWWRLETTALAATMSAGEAVLRNDGIGFMKEPHGVYGYTMKPNFSRGTTFINGSGFHQRDKVPVARQEGAFRVVCLGESTTFGNGVESNYPHFLRSILSAQAAGHTNYEVINAGVPGWISDQVALRVEHEVADYRPDAVILYVGWNDFQAYSPFDPQPVESMFDRAYKGNEWKHFATGWLRSVALLSALYHREQPAAAPPSREPGDVEPEARYRFLIQSLDRIHAAFANRNPSVRIFVSTLVGRWPDGTPEEWAKIPPVGWMSANAVAPARAAELVATLNDVLRRYADNRRLHIIDVAAAFDELDRARLQYDWAHMQSDGYELVAWTMFDALVREGAITRLTESPRPSALRALYSRRAGGHP